MQKFRSASLTVFEILGIKLNNKNNDDNDKKNWTKRVFAISPML